MKERPILFSGPMVRAILEGRKTQTRRVVKDSAVRLPNGDGQPFLVECPHGIPGDRLWVRETFQPLWNEHHEETPNWRTGEGYAISYVATSGRQEYDDDEQGLTDRCKPAIHMPRWASRIRLEITDVRVQRLQEISAEDAIAEGFGPRSSRALFRGTWEMLNAKRGFGWDANPWVWALTFKAIIPEGL